MDDKLGTFAEIGVAIAGFSGIVAALGRQSFASWPLARRNLMILLLETAGLCVLFSIVPLVLGELPLSESVVWRISGALFAVGHAVHMRVITRRSASYRTPTSKLRKGVGLIAVPILAVQFLSVFFGGLVALRFAYLLALAWHVAGGALSFGLLLVGQTEESAT